jgi:membrane-associated protease RseP (regulator of RpoE activity)
MVRRKKKNKFLSEWFWPIAVVLLIIFASGYFKTGENPIDQYFVRNWKWVTASIIILLGFYFMRKIPGAQIMFGGLFIKLNSTRGIRMMDSLGTRFSRFWIFVGNLALVLLFGGLGTAYVAHHLSDRGRRLLLTLLTFGTSYVYLSRTFVGLFDFQILLQFSSEALLVAIALAFVVYKTSPKWSKKHQVITSFVLGLLFFASYHFLFAYNYMQAGFATESYYLLLLGLSVGAIGLPAIIIVSLSFHGALIALGETTQPGVNIGYPSIEGGVPVLKYAGTDVGIPLFPDIFIGFVILVALHEGFHGLVARAQKIPIKNTGLLFLSILPGGAFVEPDEEKFKREKEDKRLRVYAVGSFANIFVVALVVFIIGNLMISTGFVERKGYIIDTVIGNSTAAKIIEPGDIIISVSGSEINGWLDFSNFMQDTVPGQSVTITTNKGVFPERLGAHPDILGRGYLGVGPRSDFSDMILERFVTAARSSNLIPSPATSLFHILKWVFFLNLMLGLVNLLPLKPLDGGYIYDGFFEWVERSLSFGRRLHLAKIFSQGFAILILAVFVINFSPYFF